MKAMKFNTYCKKLDKLTKELTEHADLLAKHSEQFTPGSCETVKDASTRLCALAALKRLAGRINRLLIELEA